MLRQAEEKLARITVTSPSLCALLFSFPDSVVWLPLKSIFLSRDFS